MTGSGGIGGSFYRLGLAAAKRRDLGAALRYASFACILEPGHEGAARLAEICRRELEGTIPEQIGLLAGQRKWKAAAKAAKAAPCQSVRLLNLEGCLWALAKRYEQAADCFAKALEKDRGDTLAPEALAETGRRRRRLGRFFCFSLPK
jgi:tetratricopeptide (TPR) repeat protein